MSELFMHHQQGELELPYSHPHIQGELFKAVHTLVRLSPQEVAVIQRKETEPQELDLYPKVEQLF